MIWQIIGVVVSPLKHAAFRLQAKFHRTRRPRVAIVCGTEILIIRNWGERRWSLPGGGLHKGESPEQCAARECREELGVAIPRHELHYITTLQRKCYDAPIYVWHTEVKPTLKLQKFEITGSRWVTREALPPLEDALKDLVVKLDF